MADIASLLVAIEDADQRTLDDIDEEIAQYQSKIKALQTLRRVIAAAVDAGPKTRAKKPSSTRATNGNGQSGNTSLTVTRREKIAEHLSIHGETRTAELKELVGMNYHDSAFYDIITHEWFEKKKGSVDLSPNGKLAWGGKEDDG